MSAPARVLELANASVLVFPDRVSACQVAAERVAHALRSAVATRGRAVLGLATGSTPEPIYAHLVALHREGTLSFANVSTYNLDEYYPISPLDPNSYRAYMHRHLFRAVDLPANQAHVLDGTVPASAAAEHAAQFDRWIAADGGLDFQLLGLGRNGHIGFNEPSELAAEAAMRLPTRLVDLHPVTLADAAKDFGDESRVISRALTVGVAPILAARSILVVAFGPNKAEAVAQSLRGPITAQVPGSLLQSASGKVTWILDEAAAGDI
ncbi:glucosamine-6-phosphate deaminase [Singulisphaera sp. GP187]|uniref:glucosamine-6-phosphate deaminase n=1 Tax=Singulisphaera sp. GP187 TaxID=1882752 RepID=UPI000927F2E5|nr:glucosamine-6-phosphate deaminase [Singulisphaera sp. GP187]SIO28746.1 glucosamine-6-phosphate deaminase [Singulisphaera sp. GP187]